MTADRNRLPVLLSFVAGIVATFALMQAAYADTGAPSPDALPAWHRDLTRILPVLVLGAFGVLHGIMRLAAWRPGWRRLRAVCVWLSVPRRRAWVASLAAALFVLVPAAAEWSVRPADVANAVGAWMLARLGMPHSEDKREAEGSVPT
jgi:hypothetical protein